MTEFKRVHVSVSPDEFTRAMKILKIFKAAVSKDLTQDFVNVVVDNDQVFFVSRIGTIMEAGVRIHIGKISDHVDNMAVRVLFSRLDLVRAKKATSNIRIKFQDDHTISVNWKEGNARKSLLIHGFASNVTADMSLQSAVLATVPIDECSPRFNATIEATRKWPGTPINKPAIVRLVPGEQGAPPIVEATDEIRIYNSGTRPGRQTQDPVIIAPHYMKAMLSVFNCVEDQSDSDELTINQFKLVSILPSIGTILVVPRQSVKFPDTSIIFNAIQNQGLSWFQVVSGEIEQLLRSLLRAKTSAPVFLTTKDHLIRLNMYSTDGLALHYKIPAVSIAEPDLEITASPGLVLAGVRAVSESQNDVLSFGAIRDQILFMEGPLGTYAFAVIRPGN